MLLRANIYQDQLNLIGQQLIYTRQMDMLMHSEQLVDKLAECFLAGNYSHDPDLDKPVVCVPENSPS